jgi:hypothetical protein
VFGSSTPQKNWFCFFGQKGGPVPPYKSYNTKNSQYIKKKQQRVAQKVPNQTTKSCKFERGVSKKPHAVLPGGNVAAPGEWLLPARQGITPCQAGTSLYQPAEKLFLGEQVQASTCSPRDNSLASWYKLAPACQGVIPWQAGTGLYPCLAKNDRYKLVPAYLGRVFLSTPI